MSRTRRGQVRMEKDGVTHDFVQESVSVWEQRGWTRVDTDGNSQPVAEPHQLATEELQASEQAEQTEQEG